MKIAYIVRNYNKRGGISGYTAELAERFSKHNEVHVYASSIEDASGRIIQHSVPMTSFPLFARMKKHSWNVAFEVPSFMKNASAMLESARYDIVHSQGDFSGACDVYTAHSCHKAWLETARANSEGGILEALKKSAYNPLHRQILKGEYYAVTRSKKVIAVSKRVKDELLGRYQLPEDKISVIYNGVDTERFGGKEAAAARSEVRKAHSLKEDDVVAVFPAHEFKRKGLVQILEAMKLLNKANFYLFVIGRDNPAGYTDLTAEYGLSKNVLFLGERKDMENYYAASDMMIFPTLYEPFGLAVTEAMAAGLPVIVSAQAGAAELITDGSDGLVLKDRNDSKELADKIARLAGSKTARAEIGQQARKTAERYSWDIIAEKTGELYAAAAGLKQ